MKKIVLLSDGTGNSSAAPQKTNVWRLYQALDTTSTSRQIAFYDNGVGTSSFSPATILGLVFGWGLASNVRQLYSYLCRTYQEGDDIYGFGFSRGAFTIRVTAALIASEGIIDPRRTTDEADFERLVSAAYNRFRKNSFTPSLLSFFLRPTRDLLLTIRDALKGLKKYDPGMNRCYEEHESNRKPLIQFLGVWDTVDAYGLPIDELTRAWDKVVWPLTQKDRDLSPRVARACHALAIDEQREAFEPMLWNENGERHHPNIKQVWFAGVHSNVGGSYPDDSQALIPLIWMMKESGLTFLPDEQQRLSAQANSTGPLYDSRAGLATLYRYAPRDIESLMHERKPGLWNWLRQTLRLSDYEENEVNVYRAKIHHSVFDRLKQASDAYAPFNLPLDYDVIDNCGELVSPNEEWAAGEKMRSERQPTVWLKVWYRRLIYFTLLFFLIGFIAYPYAKCDDTKDADGSTMCRLTTESATLSSYNGTPSAALGGLPELVGSIPGLSFAQNWTKLYATFPYKFLGGLGVLGLLFVAGGQVRKSITSEMRRNWAHITDSRPLPDKLRQNRFRTGFANFLTGPVYRNGIARPIRLALEGTTVLVLIFLVVAALSRVVYVNLDGWGAVCEPTEPTRHTGVLVSTTLKFNPKQGCFDTGVDLEKGKTYRLSYYVDSKWADASTHADAIGWYRPPPLMHLFTPVLRHWYADWYEPIARIGDTRFDQRALAPDDLDPSSLRDPVNSFTTEITPNQSGRLFLYLNDAVLFSPAFSKGFYTNNAGAADVTVDAI